MVGFCFGITNNWLLGVEHKFIIQIISFSIFIKKVFEMSLKGDGIPIQLY
jgi:hypothetical protein